MAEDSDKSTVDLTWARIRVVVIDKRPYNTQMGFGEIYITETFKGISPDEPMKLDATWENERSRLYRGEQDIERKV